MKKIAFISLGCDKNLVDSEIMLGILDKEGFIISDDEENAHTVIINTCGFIQEAVEEGINSILEIAEYKKNGSVKAIIVTGCMAQRYKKEIFDEIEEVDALIGVNQFDKISQVVKRVLNGERVDLITNPDTSINEDLNHYRMLTTPSYFGYMKIAEGCDNHCTYCTIPEIRGKYRSRTMESLIEEGEILASKGVKEIILVAQDTSSYGEDIYGENKLHILLKEISKIQGIKWIRILYCYPEKITDEVIEEIATNNKICKYIEMPIQHSEDKILKLMGRKTNKEGLKNVIKKLRDRIPSVVIRTTLIIGFPDETDEDFINLNDFIKEMKFEKLGAFAYSKEKGTKAAKMKNQIHNDIKEKRKNIIMETQNLISSKISSSYIGDTFEVIIDGYLHDDKVYCGRTYMDSYEIDGLVFLKSEKELMSGDMVFVKITDSLDYDLIGEII